MTPSLFPEIEEDVNLANFDVWLVNSSAGKDSQAMLDVMVKKADTLNLRHRIVVVHADLGKEEWPGTPELAEEHARHYGVRFVKISRPQGGLLDHVRKRKKWMDPARRYCTSDHKRGQIQKVIVALARAHGPGCRILNCFGFRAEESTNRRKKRAFGFNRKASSKGRVVYDYLPIHQMLVEDVWARIRQAGTRPHPAYAAGMKRLSCRFCIFAPKGQLMLAAQLNPELFQEYLEVEREIKHRFTLRLSLEEVEQALKAGECAPADDGNWNM